MIGKGIQALRDYFIEAATTHRLLISCDSQSPNITTHFLQHLYSARSTMRRTSRCRQAPYSYSRLRCAPRSARKTYKTHVRTCRGTRRGAGRRTYTVGGAVLFGMFVSVSTYIKITFYQYCIPELRPAALLRGGVVGCRRPTRIPQGAKGATEGILGVLREIRGAYEMRVHRGERASGEPAA